MRDSFAYLSNRIDRILGFDTLEMSIDASVGKLAMGREGRMSLL